VSALEPISGWPSGVRATLTLRGAAPGKGASSMGEVASGASDHPYQAFNLACHVGDAPEAVAENRQRLQKALGTTPAWLTQVHGSAVVEVKEASERSCREGGFPVADASFTDKTGKACAILVADCLPVLVARADGGLVGAAHAGWRGLAHGVVPALLNALQAQDPVAARMGFFVWLGPCIGPRHFEVGPEVKAAFETHPLIRKGEVDALFSQGRGDRLLADLAGLARAQCRNWARQQGLPDPKIAIDGRCTVSDPDHFFSYRRDGITGRMAALIWRDPD